MELADAVDAVEMDLVHAMGSSLRLVVRCVLVVERPLVSWLGEGAVMFYGVLSGRKDNRSGGRCVRNQVAPLSVSIIEEKKFGVISI
jgi:hypothetical protein